MRKPLPLLSILFVCLAFLPAAPEDSEWVLRKEKDGIHVFTRKSMESNIKELKMTFTTQASLSNMVAMLNDTEAYKDWVYRALESSTLKKFSATHSIYYGAFDFPWPLADRDIVGESTIVQDPKSKVVKITTKAIEGHVPVKEDLVRIVSHQNQWIFKPQSDGTVDIEYYLSSDPGGSIPAWAINMVLDQGSTQTMEAFLSRLSHESYQNAQLSYIMD